MTHAQTRSLFTALFAFLVSASITPLAGAMQSPATTIEAPVPAALRPYIDRMNAPLTPMELPDYVDGDLPDSISRQQALEDVEVLAYLLDNAYSGRHYWQQRGVDFPRAYGSLRRQFLILGRGQAQGAGSLFRIRQAAAPYFIWNLLANDGGITQYPAAFIENFNGLQQDESWEAHLHSTPIAQAYLPGKNGWSTWPSTWLDDAIPLTDIPDYKREHVRQVRQERVELVAHPRRYWVVVREKPEPKLGDYAGRVVILSNYRNGSAGNNALAMSKSIPNSVIVGENSNMTYAFANTRNFSLKNSRIKLRLPGRLIINPANSIERGFLPDFWLDSETPVEEVVEWLRHPESYQFKYLDPE